MAGNYTVKQGDHVSKIASVFGFSNFRTIWDHPENAKLKKERTNPNVLFPGDSLFIPDRQQREEACNTDKRHRFIAKTPVLKLRLVLEDLYEKPIANAQCLLVLGTASLNLTTDANGRIERDLPPDVHDAVLTIQDAQTPFKDTVIPIRIGDLDPVDQVSGQRARLNNLGYFSGDASQPGDQDFESAVEEFQCDNGLQVDGICGPKTQARLKQVHGC